MSTFAVISDPHVTIPNPETGWTPPAIPNEPTLYSRSVELLESAISEINAVPELDFVLVAGDLTKDSEPYNHARARDLLSQFRKPVFCVSGNHDQPRIRQYRPPEFLDPQVQPVRTSEIPGWYRDFGFKDGQRTAYSCDPTPDVHLVGICSAKPDEDRGYIAPDVLAWLDDDLARQRDPERTTIVMLHHSIMDHVPGESASPTFYWFQVENAPDVRAVLRKHQVRLTLTGHLHIQDVKEENGLYNIVTASLAGYPHAYRLITLVNGVLRVRSQRLHSIPSRPDLQEFSRRYTADVFVRMIADGLTGPPFHYARERAEPIACRLDAWWPSIADGDEHFAYTAEELGDEAVAAYFNAFSDRPPADNDLEIELTGS